jgi:hypothetical protein
MSINCLLFLFALPAAASTDIGPGDAARMKMEAQIDSTISHIHGRSDMMTPEDGDMTSGHNAENQDCANTFVQKKRSDGTTVIDRAEVCDRPH